MLLVSVAILLPATLAVGVLATQRIAGPAFHRTRVREFCEKQYMPESSDWAIGWDTPTKGVSTSGELFSEKSVGHTGFTGTSLWIDLERELIVVMLTNRIHQVVKRSKFTLRPKIHDAIVDAFTAS